MAKHVHTPGAVVGEFARQVGREPVDEGDFVICKTCGKQYELKRKPTYHKMERERERKRK